MIGYKTDTSVNFSGRKIQIEICVLKAIRQKTEIKKVAENLVPATSAVFCLFVFT